MSKKFYNILIIFVLFIFFTGFQNENRLPDEITSIIEEVEKIYCPDKRLYVFNVTANIQNSKIVLQGEILSPEGKNELVKKLEKLQQYEIEDQLIVLPHPELECKNYGIIRISAAQLRRNIGIKSEIISQAIMGAEVRILKSNDLTKNSYWYYCQMEDNYLGWMTKSSFIVGDKEFIDSWREKRKVIVTSNYAQVWEKPAKTSRPVSDLVRGNKLIDVNLLDNWYEVQLPDGRKGYVHGENVAEEETLLERPKPTAEEILNTAFSLMGVPYLWGGTSVKGLDCSGFTQSIYKFHGIKLPRDANMQVNIGDEVSLADSLKHLQPANLLFWGASKATITHVGIYIGNDRFIHNDGLVRINSFNPNHEEYNKYRHKALKAARRILQ